MITGDLHPEMVVNLWGRTELISSPGGFGHLGRSVFRRRLQCNAFGCSWQEVWQTAWSWAKRRSLELSLKMAGTTGLEPAASAVTEWQHGVTW